jgi:hypothetical protein
MNNILLGTNFFTILIVVWFAFYFNQMIRAMLDLNDEILVAAGLREPKVMDESQTSLTDFTQEE